MEVLGPSACSEEGEWLWAFQGVPVPLKVVLLATLALLPPYTGSLARDRGFSVSHWFKPGIPS